MNKQRVIWVLKEMGDLLEIGEGNSFEIMAYRNAGRALDDWDGDLEVAVTEGSLSFIPRIGKGISRIITELVRDGRSTEHERIGGMFPPGLPELLKLSGIGPKKVKALWRELGIESLNALERAARDGKVRALRGFGLKTEERILGSIDRRKARATAAPKAVPKPAPKERKPAASSGRILAGTSGYAYTEWKGSFYPEDLSKKDFLRFYSERFATVEINNSFYRFPSENALKGWAEQASPDFLFTIKANQRITHRGRLKEVGEVTQSFTERCGILGDRLGCILLQCPPDLKADEGRLAEFLSHLVPGVRYAIEFRHDSWFMDQTFGLLNDHHVALVVHDGEGLSCPRLATTSFVYIRLRQDEYDDETLDGWNKWIEDQASGGRDVFVYLKHDDHGTSPAAILDRVTRRATAPARRMAKSKKRPARRGRRGA